MDNDTKICTGCKRILPATEEYFHKYPKNHVCHGKLRPKCRDCAKAYNESTKGHRAKRDAEYHQKHAEKRRAYARYYYQENKEEMLASARIRYKRNFESIKKQKLEYTRKNRAKVRAYLNKYYAQHPGYGKASLHRRRAKKKSLPATFKSYHWDLCVKYFRGRCAVCENQLKDLFGNVKPHADHWIPLNSPDCIGTTPDNMICLCNDCNLRKSDHDPKEWLTRQYGKKRAKVIMEKVNEYFRWIMRHEDELWMN